MKKNRELSFVVLLLLGIVFCLAGMFILHFYLIQPLRMVEKSYSWTSVPAVVSSSRVDSCCLENICSIKIHYKYTFDKQEYQGERYDFFRSQNKIYWGKPELQKIVNDYPAGKAIHCLVNPDDPSESVISKDIIFNSLFLVPCFLILLGIILFAEAIKTFLKKKNIDVDPPPLSKELLPEYTFSPAIERILTKMELQAVGIALCIIIFYFYFKSLAANIAIFVIGMMIFVLLSLRICPKCGKRLQTYEEKEKDGNGEWRILCCHKCKIKSKVHYIPDYGVES